jgi:hypothetical protein
MKSILIAVLLVTTTNLVGCVYDPYHDHDGGRYENRRDRDDRDHRGEQRGDDRRDGRGEQGREH